jgi:hypothetical protein
MVRSEGPSTAIGADLQCYDVIESAKGKMQWRPERNAIGHTHDSASSGAKA